MKSVSFTFYCRSCAWMTDAGFRLSVDQLGYLLPAGLAVPVQEHAMSLEMFN